ncbi:porin [Sphaerotilaceae bacterium SBD11-9]
MHKRTLHKTLLATAALLAVGAAQAQSSVVAYGLIDLAVNNFKAGDALGGTDVWKLVDGTQNGFNGSRLGFRTSEDLGGGLKANALMEMGLTADNGNLGQGGRAFGRQVYVGLSSATLGEIRMGRQYILEDSVMSYATPWGNAAVNNTGTAVTNMGGNLPFWLNAPRADNVLQYQTPSFGGFYAAAQIAPGEATADRFHGLKLSYQAGNLNVGASYEWSKSRTTGDDINKSLTLGGNYNFGFMKLVGGYQANEDLRLNSGNGAFIGNNLTVNVGGATPTFVADKITGYTLGAVFPVGAFEIGVNFTDVEYESMAGRTATLGKGAGTVRYNLSKNTFLYSGYSFSSGDLKDRISESQVFQAGLRMAW